MATPTISEKKIVNTLTIEELLKRNKEYATTKHHTLPPLLQLFGGSFSHGPHTIVVACLDSRCNPYEIFSLTQAEAIVIRNPGGRIFTALPDIVALDSRFSISQIVLLQHSDCGTSHLTKELVHERIAESKEPKSEETVKMREEVCEWKVSRGEEGVRMDLEFLKGKVFLRRELVESAVGFWMDTTTGVVKRVE